MKKKLVLLSCLFSLVSAAENSSIDQIVQGFGAFGIEQSQVDMLAGMFGSLSIDRTTPQTISLMALLIKVITYDSQPKSEGNGIIQLIECKNKKEKGVPLIESDITAFSDALLNGEPDIIRKKFAENMVLEKIKIKNLEPVKKQLEEWKYTSCSDLAQLLPTLPLELLFSSEIDIAQPMEID